MVIMVDMTRGYHGRNEHYHGSDGSIYDVSHDWMLGLGCCKYHVELSA